MKPIYKKTLAATVGLVSAVGIAGQANAIVHGGSNNLLQSLSVLITGVNQPNVKSYSFSLLNISNLNGIPGVSVGGCGGTIIGGATTTCTGFTLPGSGPAPVLYGGVAESAGSNPSRGAQNFSFLGPVAGNEFASADSIIDDAQLVGDALTATRGIAEAELDAGTNAAANATIQSNTTLAFTFTASGPGTITISFEADPELQVTIQDPPPPPGAMTADAQASLNYSFLISQDGTNNSLNWEPGGGDCATDVEKTGSGINCSSAVSAEDLNNLISVGTVPNSSDSYSSGGGFGNYSWTATFNAAGNYVFTFTGINAVQVSRTPGVAVPEPGVLLLLGSGLLGLGFARRARSRKTRS